MQNSYIYGKVKKYMSQEMLSLEENSLQDQWRPGIIDTIINVYDDLEMNCVMLIIYCWYRQFSEKHSIRFYIKDNISQNDDNLCTLLNKSNTQQSNISYESVQRDDKIYDEAIYTYKTFRIDKDTFAKNFFSNRPIEFQGLYKRFDSYKTGARINKLSGQELSYESFIELIFLKKYSILSLMRRKKFSDSKNLSHYDFETEFFSQIKDKNSGIYYDAISSDMCKNAGSLIRAINLYAIENNCHFERNYRLAKALSDAKLNKAIREEEKNVLAHLNYFQDGNRNYQDSIVRGYDKILACYDGENIDARDIYDIVHLCNYMMRYVMDVISFELDKEKINIKELYENEIITLNDFFDDFIGRGQHIAEKDINEIQIKDFRDLYKIDQL